ncbi:MAG TPA: hypothetical protein VF173_33395 [Thermoanaerobaculia bacterium]|nr:hypothetical protein [Thermoanaerobaculia bacterium]
MRNLSKCLVTSVFLALALLAAGHSASAAMAPTPPGELLAVDACGCCPATCLGGTFIGCYHTIAMPPNAVTCVYIKDGKAFDCVSCLLASTTDTTEAAYNAIFGDASPACPKAAE